MSNWTHVAGIIRVDGIIESSDMGNEIKRIIGKEVHFDSSMDEWNDFDRNPEEYLPCGSEGTLRMTLWENPNKSSMAAYTVSIFGDLRDHDSPTEIIKWFRGRVLMLDCISCGVRNACVVADNEYYGVENWAYNERATRQFFNENYEAVTLMYDEIGMSLGFEDGVIVGFDDIDWTLNHLKNLGYRIGEEDA